MKNLRICGVELKSSSAILAIVENSNEVNLIDIETRKIEIANHEDSSDIKSFYNNFCSFINDNSIDVVVIKKRATKGTFAGGAVSFKLESLIQLNDKSPVIFVSGQAIKAMNKGSLAELPKNLKKYQEQAYLAAVTYIRKNID